MCIYKCLQLARFFLRVMKGDIHPSPERYLSLLVIRSRCYICPYKPGLPSPYFEDTGYVVVMVVPDQLPTAKHLILYSSLSIQAPSAGWGREVDMVYTACTVQGQINTYQLPPASETWQRFLNAQTALNSFGHFLKLMSSRNDCICT